MHIEYNLTFKEKNEQNEKNGLILMITFTCY